MNKSNISELIQAISEIRATPFISDGEALTKKVSQTVKILAAFFFKLSLGNRPPLIVSFQGGTGTGKTSLLNALAGRRVGLPGVERPKTTGPVLYCHASHLEVFDDSAFLPDFETIVMDVDDIPPEGLTGWPAKLLLVKHTDPKWESMVLVDNPDLDSVDLANHQMAEDIYALADLIIFVTSEEKYADRLPSEMIKQANEDGKRMLFAFNKSESSQAKDDFLAQVGPGAVPFEDVFVIPYVRGAGVTLSDLERRLAGLATEDEVPRLRSRELDRLRDRGRTRLKLIGDELSAEKVQLDTILADVKVFHEQALFHLMETMDARLDEQTKKHIREHLKEMMQKYDFMASPRKYIKDFVMSRLRLKSAEPGAAAVPVEDTQQTDLARIRVLVNLNPALESLTMFNHALSHHLSDLPSDQPLLAAISEPGVILSKEAIQAAFDGRQDEIDAWIRERFEALRKGLPPGQKAGLYSASVLWMICIVMIESAIGGGLTFFELLLGSVVVPFVPKVMVELFTRGEVAAIGRELNQRYQDTYTQILEDQLKRYQDLFSSHCNPPEATAAVYDASDLLVKKYGLRLLD
ncbi:MAG: hypothetical protein HQK60_15660 [Deltaproteobacteria bacterium]|nr:hypothetical protein [Deltaproteobacteria bacterium]